MLLSFGIRGCSWFRMVSGGAICFRGLPSFPWVIPSCSGVPFRELCFCVCAMAMQSVLASRSNVHVILECWAIVMCSRAFGDLLARVA